MPDELKHTIDTYLTNYVNLCNEMIGKMRDGKPINDNALSVLNDSTRVIAGYMPKGYAFAMDSLIGNITTNKLP